MAGGQPQPEHRVVTTAFLRFEGVDALIAEEGLEAAADAIEDLVAHTQAVADEFEVCFLQSDVDADGGKLTLTAGAPRMVGDDEERMLLALRQIAARPRRLPLRIGVNRGSVFCGDVGAPFRRAYTIMGDAVNLAARLMSHAPAGEIYATPGVLERSATRFDVKPMAAFTVKGKREPVEAWSVGSPLGSRASEGIAVRFPLVGRDPELAALGDALADARAGAGRLVEIAGEPGIGKTRLAEELRARAGGMSRLRVTCEAYTLGHAVHHLARPAAPARRRRLGGPGLDRRRAPAHRRPRPRAGARAVAPAAGHPARRRPAADARGRRAGARLPPRAPARGHAALPARAGCPDRR